MARETPASLTRTRCTPRFEGRIQTRNRPRLPDGLTATIRRWTGGRASLIYYAVLAAFSIWAVYTMRFAGPFALFKVMANVAGFVMAVAGVQILIVNRRFLPRELRPPLYRELMLVLCIAFYGFFSVRVFLSML